jgi:hypothetical protein
MCVPGSTVLEHALPQAVPDLRGEFLWRAKMKKTEMLIVTGMFVLAGLSPGYARGGMHSTGPSALMAPANPTVLPSLSPDSTHWQRTSSAASSADARRRFFDLRPMRKM